MLEYGSALLGLAAVLIGVVGGTWDKSKQGWRRITKTGLCATIIGVVACSISILQSNVNQRKLEWQELQKAKIREIAEAELHEAVRQLLYPFEVLAMEIKYEFDDAPPMVGNFYTDHDARTEWLSDPMVITKFDEIYLSDTSRFFSLGTWGYFFHRSAKRSIDRINETLAKYSLYLDAETILDIKRLEEHEFTQLSLILNMENHLEFDENDRTPISVVFFHRLVKHGGGLHEASVYEDFIKLTDRIIRRLPMPQWQIETSERIQAINEANKAEQDAAEQPATAVEPK